MEEVRKILIAGGSGLIGMRLTHLLVNKGYQVAILSRSNKSRNGIKYYQWDPASRKYDPTCLNETDTIVNLAGAGIADKRWTSERKSIIIESRANAADTICSMLEDNSHTVRTVINASAIGYYGDRGKELLSERSGPSSGFLSRSTQEWEKYTSKISETSVRNCILRIGVVLSNEGGAFPKLKQTLPFRFLPIFGNGKQFISWIYIDDLCNMILYAIENDNITGTYNATAPIPVTNTEFMNELTILKPGPVIKTPIPKFVLRLLLGEKAAVVLEGSNVSSKKIQNSGFQFMYTNIKSCLKNLTNAKH